MSETGAHTHDIPFKFSVGTKVQKHSGYRFPGVVRSNFYTSKGNKRYAVEAISGDFEEMLHIFNEEQLTEREE